MGLAAPQARLLTLTRRKADCELRQLINNRRKMSLMREQSELATQYYSLLNTKQLSYYKDGQYNKLDYTYLMGKPMSTYTTSDKYVKKDNYNMVLTDSKGLVVIDDYYAKRFVAAGLTIGKDGKGGTFGQDMIAKVLSTIILGTGESDVDSKLYSPANIAKVLGGGTIPNSDYTVKQINAYTGKTLSEGEAREVNLAEIIQEKLAYFYPIVLAAATNGWTTEYNSKIDSIRDGKSNPAYDEDYINDALISGVFRLAVVDEEGTYRPGTSVEYFTTCGSILENTSSDDREALTAWYNAQRSLYTEKENYIEIESTELSAELEAIKTSITSIESFIKDAITSVFDWGNA